MHFDVSSIIWLFFMFTALQPLFAKRMLSAARQRIIAAFEKKRRSRVILLIHR